METPSQRLNRIRDLVAAEPGLVNVIGKTMIWEPIEVREFLSNQFDIEPAELSMIEDAIRATRPQPAQKTGSL
jgi:hypothetical protein